MVKIRPWSSAQLLSNNDSGLSSFCIPESTPMPNSSGLSEALRVPIDALAPPPKAKLPLALRGTGPWTVTILCNGKFYKELVVPAPTKGNDVVITMIEVEHKATYSVGSIIDGNGVEGRVSSNTSDSNGSINVASCPQARLDGLIVKEGIEMCNNSIIPIKVWLVGSGQFSALVFDIVTDDGVEKLTIFDITIAPNSPRYGPFSLFILNFDIKDILAKNKSSKLSVDPQSILLRLSSIQDLNGRIHEYGQWDIGDSVIIKVQAPPIIRWLAADRPVKLLDDGNAASLSLVLSGKAPFEFSVRNPDGKVEKQTSHNFTLAHLAKLPGSYKLVQVKDALCTGFVDIRDEIVVQMVYPPSLKVTSAPIKGPCKGSMGLEFDLFLTGEGPWRITLKQALSKLNKGQREIVESALELDIYTSRYLYRWKPDVPGLYTLTFVFIADVNYHRPRPLSGLSFIQDISPASFVSFASVPKEGLFTCVGQSVKTQLKFGGIGPWFLEYSIMDPKKILTTHKVEAVDNESSIVINQLQAGGLYTMTLIKLTDSTGCESHVSSQSLTINVFQHAPSVKFTKSNVILREGFKDPVPIELHANGLPMTLKFEHEDGSQHEISTSSNELYLDKTGRWTISKARDKYCLALVKDIDTIEVSILSKPSVSFSSPLVGWTSRSRHSFNPVSVILRGSGSVSLTYTIQYAVEENLVELASKETHIITGSDSQALPLLSIEKSLPVPGFYRFSLASIKDSYFPEMPVSDDVHFVQQVLPDPIPRIISTHVKGNSFCFDPSNPIAGQIYIDFAGGDLKDMFPITIKYELLRSNKVEQVETAQVDSSRIFALQFISQPGSYHLRIIHVRNNRGGVWEVSPKVNLVSQLRDQSAMTINFVERPSFRLFSPDNLCVGDVARFDLFGTGPWTMKYTLKGKLKTDTVTSNRLNILLAEPGPLEIDSLCNKHCCAGEIPNHPPAKPWQYAVFPLPSAAISEGTQFVREGEEAEFVVSLSGTPPFNYRYQRIDDADNRIIETIENKNIPVHEHRVKVSSQGTFKVIFVRDKHCQYPKGASSSER